MITKMIMPTTILLAGDELGERRDHVARPRSRRRVPARVRISRVVATLSTSRASVVASSSDGKDAELQRRAHVDRRQQHDHRDA